MESRRVRILTTVLLSVLLSVMLTGCTPDETEGDTGAYYVISEELDVIRTADKAQEILENAGAQEDKDHRN